MGPEKATEASIGSGGAAEVRTGSRGAEEAKTGRVVPCGPGSIVWWWFSQGRVLEALGQVWRQPGAQPTASVSSSCG